MNLPASRLLPATLLVIVVLLTVAPIAIGQEEAPAPEQPQQQTVDVPTPAVEIAPDTPAVEILPWTFRYLIPTSLVIAVVAVVGSIIAYFLRVVRTRYRVVR